MTIPWPIEVGRSGMVVGMVANYDTLPADIPPERLIPSTSGVPIVDGPLVHHAEPASVALSEYAQREPLAVVDVAPEQNRLVARGWLTAATLERDQVDDLVTALGYGVVSDFRAVMVGGVPRLLLVALVLERATPPTPKD